LQKQLTEDLKFYNEALENFASIVSHDLREPLRTISSFLQFIEDKYSNQLDSEGKEFIQFAINGSKRMDNMIKGLLAYSRVGGNPDKFKITSMDKILRNVINDLNELIIEKKAIITSDSLPEIYCDETLISELLQNLIGNSIKYSDKVKPKIHVSAEENDDKWIFSVNDNGIGFDSETVKDNIFLMFKRIHIDQEFEGRGIGLATCKKIINIHEGEIWAKSKPGEGATFYFSTPKYPQSKKH